MLQPLFLPTQDSYLGLGTSVWYQSIDPEIMLPRRNQRVQEEYYEESLFYDTDDGEDVDAIIRDEPIFDEEDEDDDELIDFIGIDKILHSYIPLNFILVFFPFWPIFLRHI